MALVVVGMAEGQIANPRLPRNVPSATAMVPRSDVAACGRQTRRVGCSNHQRARHIYSTSPGSTVLAAGVAHLEEAPQIGVNDDAIFDSIGEICGSVAGIHVDRDNG